MTDLDAIKRELTQAKIERRAAATAATKAQKQYDAARRRVDRLLIEIKQIEAASEAGEAKREKARTELREKIARKLERKPLTFPEQGNIWADARVKGGWESSVSIHHNLVQVPPDGQTIEDYLEKYNDDRYYEHAYDANDLPDYITDDWPWEPRTGETAKASIVAWVTYRDTATADETARVQARIMHEVEFDASGAAPTSEQLLAAWDAAWAKMLDAPLAPMYPEFVN